MDGPQHIRQKEPEALGRATSPGAGPARTRRAGSSPETQTQHNTTQHNTTQHNTTQHNTTQHNTTQHNTTQHTT